MKHIENVFNIDIKDMFSRHNQAVASRVSNSAGIRCNRVLFYYDK